MLVFTRETGQSVQASDATVVGRLRDLTARLGAEHPTVHRLAIGSRRHVTHLVPWSAVTAFEPSGVQLRDLGALAAFAIDSHCIPLEDDELLLGRDVLDTQIVDIVGHRLARVSDMLLTRLPDGRLELAAVEVGIGAVLRRLGLRWLSEQFPERAVDWGDLHLTSDRGHDVHLATAAANLPSTTKGHPSPHRGPNSSTLSPLNRLIAKRLDPDKSASISRLRGVIRD